MVLGLVRVRFGVTGLDRRTKINKYLYIYIYVYNMYIHMNIYIYIYADI